MLPFQPQQPLPTPGMDMPPTDPADPAGLLPPEPPGWLDQVAFEPIGPQPPAWWTPLPKPKIKDVTEIASREKADHQARRKLLADCDDMLAARDNPIGSFASEEDVAAHRVETWHLTTLKDEHALGCELARKHEWAIEALYLDPIDEEEAAAKEDCALYLLECWERMHATALMGNLRWSLADAAMRRGMIVSFAGIDPDNDECGLRLRWIDPATCYPVSEAERGLSHLVRVYPSTAGRVLGAFGDADGKIQRKLYRTQRPSAADTYGPHTVGEVTEYWDRQWCMVLFDGKEIDCYEHGYLRVPFRVTLAPWGEPTDAARLSDDSYGLASSGRYALRDRWTRIAPPFWTRRLLGHLQAEALAGQAVTMFKKSLNPPRIVKQNIVSEQGDSPEISNDEGVMNYVREDEDVAELKFPLDPQVTAAVMGFQQKNDATGAASPAAFGGAPMSQGSGDAIATLDENALRQYGPVLDMIQQHITDVLEDCLGLLRDFGPLLGNADDPGVIKVPRRVNPRTGASPAHQVTADLIKRTGKRLRVRLYRDMPPDPALASSAMMLGTSSLVARERVQRWLGITDPKGETRTIRLDRLSDVPEVAQTETLDELFRQVQVAQARGDTATAKQAWARAMRVAEAIDMANAQKQMMRAQMGMGPPGTPAAMHAGPAPAVAAPPDPSLPGFQGHGADMGVVQQQNGGRPPGGN